MTLSHLVHSYFCWKCMCTKGESSCWVTDNSNHCDRELRVWVQWCLSLLSGVYHFVHHILPAKTCLPQLLSLPQKRWHQFCIQMAHLNLEQFKRLPLQVIEQTGKEALQVLKVLK